MNTFSHKSPRRRIVPRTVLFLLLLGVCVVLYLGYGPGNEKTHAAPAMTFVVTNVNDSGAGSLRQAILDANANPGSDTITFVITGSSRLIQPLLGLPDITDPVVIDGSTQPGFAGTPIIELNGSKSAVRALFVNAPGSTIRGLVINGFSTGGIIIGPSGGGSHVEGCYIGTDVTGSIAIPNTGSGIAVFSSNNVIGGTTTSARNVISGNDESGVQVRLFCCSSNNAMSGNVIQGNYIGITADGKTRLSNGRHGIDISTSASDASVTNTLVGGTTPGAGNVISGNREDGVFIGSFTTTATTVQGNRIGTNASGMARVPNDGDGIRIDLGSNNVIGGSAPGAGNLISGNGRGGSGTGRGSGISVGSSNNVIKGNLIGTDVTGMGPLGNLDNGIMGGRNTTIGGTGAGDGNVIAFNGLSGITNNGALGTGNSIRGNSIHSNGALASPFTLLGLGSDLGAFGPTANDPGDADTGSNNLQNFPIITSVMVGANSTNVKGSLNSVAGSTFNLEFFRNSACDPLGNGEGEHLIGTTVVTTDAAGNASFDVTLTGTTVTTEVITTTATDQAGNTSEFSPCAPVSSFGLSIGDVSALEGNSGTKNFSFPVTLQAAATQEVVISFATQDASALAPAGDYVAASGTVNIPVGQTSAQIVIQVNGDTTEEPDETFFVRLTSATNAGIVDAQGQGTILNDDVAPPLRLILDESGPGANQVAILDASLFVRDPLRVVNLGNVLNTSGNPNTSVTVFAENLTLAFFELPSTVQVNFTDSNNQNFVSFADHVGTVTISGLTLQQVSFRLPTGLAPGTCTIKLTVHDKVSNTATFRIAAP